MSEITLRIFEHPIGPVNGYNTIPANTPVFMYDETPLQQNAPEKQLIILIFNI